MTAPHQSGVRLGYVARVRGGDRVAAWVEEGGVPVYGAGDLLGFTNKANAAASDIVVGRVGSVGSLRLLTSDAWATDNTLVISFDRDRVEPRFAIHAMRQIDVGEITSGTAMPLVTGSKLLRQAVPLPRLEEQLAIADYLDRETARIDMLIEEQQRLIVMLRERRHALVNSAFQGHPTNTRLQRACLDVVDCLHTTPEIDEEGRYEAVRTSSVRDGKYRPGNGIPVSEETWTARNAGGAPSIGDVLFTREAPAGEACMVPDAEICLGQRMVLLRIDPETCDGDFLVWQLYTDRIQDHFALSANGSTVSNVRLPVLRAMSIWLPDRVQQRRVGAYLDQKTAKIDQLIEETGRFIGLSRERRAALITAAVTGQIDVREVA